MELTQEVRDTIDAMDYESMLRKWRFAPVGDAMFSGESGDYYRKVMLEKKVLCDHVEVSKRVGWDA